MRYHNHSACKAFQIFFQHLQGLYIQIVRRFIQKQQIRAAHQYTQQQQPSLFSAGKLFHPAVLQFARKQKPLQHLAGRNHALLGMHVLCNLPHHVNHALFGIQFFALLGKITDFHRFAPNNASAIRSNLAAKQFQQRAFPASVFAYQADSVPRQYNIGKIGNDGLSVIRFCHMVCFQRFSAQPCG